MLAQFNIHPLQANTQNPSSSNTTFNAQLDAHHVSQQPVSTPASGPRSTPAPTPRRTFNTNWNDRAKLGEMNRLILMVAIGLADPVEMDAFHDGYTKYRNFQQTAHDIARFYYRLGQDKKNPHREEDLERALRLKKTMEDVNAKTFVDLFHEKRGAKKQQQLNRHKQRLMSTLRQVELAVGLQRNIGGL